MRVPNDFTPGSVPCCAAMLPRTTSAMPPCAAFTMNSLSASASVLAVPPVAPVPVFVPVVSFDTIVDVVAVSVAYAVVWSEVSDLWQARARKRSAKASRFTAIPPFLRETKSAGTGPAKTRRMSPSRSGSFMTIDQLPRPASAASDAARLQRLAACRVNNANREPLFDQLVADAARLLGVPVAVLGFLDADREWVKAAVGWNVISLPGQYSLAARLLHERDTTVVTDMSTDPRFAEHPMVSGAPFLRFLAAVPLIDDDGFFLGALTILALSTRALTQEQSDMLRNLAGRILAELRARRLSADVDRLATEAADAQERFREFFERTTDLIMSIDADGRLLHVNGAVLDALRMKREELIDHPLSDIVAAAPRDHVRMPSGEVLAPGQPKPIETVFVTSTGKRINVEGSVHPKVI